MQRLRFKPPYTHVCMNKQNANRRICFKKVSRAIPVTCVFACIKRFRPILLFRRGLCNKHQTENHKNYHQGNGEKCTICIHFLLFPLLKAGDLKFNRGKLFNAGFLEALQEEDWQCFIFHDVDLLPEDARNMYTCPTQPRHMSVEVDTMDYR